MFEKNIQIVQIRNGWLLILPPKPPQMPFDMSGLVRRLTKDVTHDEELERLRSPSFEVPAMPMQLQGSMEEDIMFFPTVKELFKYLELEEEGS